MTDAFSRHTERLANQRREAIDTFIKVYVPVWQVKIIMKFPFLVRLFGWETNYETIIGDFGTKVILKRYGKFVAQLTITETITPSPTPTSKK